MVSYTLCIMMVPFLWSPSVANSGWHSSWFLRSISLVLWCCRYVDAWDMLVLVSTMTAAAVTRVINGCWCWWQSAGQSTSRGEWQRECSPILTSIYTDIHIILRRPHPLFLYRNFLLVFSYKHCQSAVSPPDIFANKSAHPWRFL